MENSRYRENLYARYGLKNTMEDRPFSISFIDSFLDCPYKCFMTYIAGLWKDSGSIPLKFGSGCHSGLALVNQSMQFDRDYCNNCKHECKLRPEIKDPSGKMSIVEIKKLKKEIRAKALDVPVSECAVKRVLQQAFNSEFFDKVFQQKAIEDMKKKDATLTDADIDKTMDEHSDIAMACVYDAVFVRQPIGTVLMSEQAINGVLAGTKITGIMDLCLATEANNGGSDLMILDYKTASPGKQTEPVRQLCLYTYLIQEMLKKGGNEKTVDFIAALRMYKKKKPAKPRVPFVQSDLWWKDLRSEPDLYPKTIKEITEDIDQIQQCLHSGVFMKNRRSMSCFYCENKDLCHDINLFEKKLAEKKEEKLKPSWVE